MLRITTRGDLKMPLQRIIDKYKIESCDIQDLLEWCIYVSSGSKQKQKTPTQKKAKPDDYAPSIEVIDCSIRVLRMDSDFFARPLSKAALGFIPKNGGDMIVKEFTAIEFSSIAFDGVAEVNNTFGLNNCKIKPYMYKFVGDDFVLFNNMQALMNFDYLVTVTRKVQKIHCPVEIKELEISGFKEVNQGVQNGTTQIHGNS